MSTTTTSSVYEDCLASTSNADSLLLCISSSLEAQQALQYKSLTSWFLIYAAALVFFMQAGFAMLCAGSVRLKNVQNTMLKNLLDACGAALGFFSVGYAFAFGDDFNTSSTHKTFIGTSKFLMINIESYADWMFQFAFAATSATIVAGTLAERCQMGAYLLYSILLTGFVYPVVAHSIWSVHGFMSAYSTEPLWNSGMVDFAGSGVVHVTGGTTAIFASIILGPRRGRFYDARGVPLRRPKPFPGHSVALQMLGTFILWFGWYGFNPGSALTLSVETTGVTGDIASLAAVTTTLSAAAGAVTALFTRMVMQERRTGEAKFDLLMAMNGSLSGLVAITGNCSVVEPWAAVVIGMVAGWLYLLGSHLLILMKIDDAVDAIPVHFVNGVWGVIATGLFAVPSHLQQTYGRSIHVGWFYSWGRGSADMTLLACQLVGLLWILGWVMAIMVPFFLYLNIKGWFRADSLEELVGLDISYHGGSAMHTDEVKSEYIEAYKRSKAGQLRRRQLSNETRTRSGSARPSRGGEDDDYGEEEHDDGLDYGVELRGVEEYKKEEKEEGKEEEEFSHRA